MNYPSSPLSVRGLLATALLLVVGSAQAGTLYIGVPILHDAGN